MTNLTMGSLFAGVGGFDIAAERNGIEVLWQSENDKHASETLAEHFPNIPNYGDIHDISSAPKVDILAGGFPCPSYSVAGNRGGLADDRGALWWEFHRLISEGKPTWVLGENVPGLLSSSRGEDFATIIKSLVQLGYGVVWRVLDAQWFGVAQRRKRVFIVGHIRGRPRPEVLALAESLSGNPQPNREKRTANTSHIDNGTDGSRELGTDHPITFHATQAPIHNETGITPVLSANSYIAVASPAIRRLTPLEGERLQGFPDNWTSGQTDTQRYQQMGNAVAVPVAEWVLGRIVMAENGEI